MARRKRHYRNVQTRNAIPTRGRVNVQRQRYYHNRAARSLNVRPVVLNVFPIPIRSKGVTRVKPVAVPTRKPLSKRQSIIGRQVITKKLRCERAKDIRRHNFFKAKAQGGASRPQHKRRHPKCGP